MQLVLHLTKQSEKNFLNMLKLVHKFAEDQLILTHNMAEELAFEKELVEISELVETDFDSAGDSYNMEI